MSQIRPPEDEMPGRRVAYTIAVIGVLLALVALGLLLLPRLLGGG